MFLRPVTHISRFGSDPDTAVRAVAESAVVM
jgi:hypothetical protein